MKRKEFFKAVAATPIIIGAAKKTEAARKAAEITETINPKNMIGSGTSRELKQAYDEFLDGTGNLLRTATRLSDCLVDDMYVPCTKGFYKKTQEGRGG